MKASPSYHQRFAYLEFLEGVMIDKTEELIYAPDSTQFTFDSLTTQGHQVSDFCWNLLSGDATRKQHDSLLDQAIQFMTNHLVYLDNIPAFSLTANQLEKNPVLVLHVSTHTPNTIALNLKPSSPHDLKPS